MENYFLVRIITPTAVQSLLDFGLSPADAIVAALRRSGLGANDDITVFCRRLPPRPEGLPFSEYATHLRTKHDAD